MTRQGPPVETTGGDVAGPHHPTQPAPIGRPHSKLAVAVTGALVGVVHALDAATGDGGDFGVDPLAPELVNVRALLRVAREALLAADGVLLDARAGRPADVSWAGLDVSLMGLFAGIDAADEPALVRHHLPECECGACPCDVDDCDSHHCPRCGCHTLARVASCEACDLADGSDAP